MRVMSAITNYFICRRIMILNDFQKKRQSFSFTTTLGISFPLIVAEHEFIRYDVTSTWRKKCRKVSMFTFCVNPLNMLVLAGNALSTRTDDLVCQNNFPLPA